MGDIKNKRNYQNVSWEHTQVEDYDLVRHFVEMNNSFPNNLLYVGNDKHGYVSYSLITDKIKELGGEIVFKSSLYKSGVRKVYYLLNNNFILLESIYFKESSSFTNIPKELEDEFYLTVSAQVTFLFSSNEIPKELQSLLDSSILKLTTQTTVGIISRDNSGFFLNDMALEAEICVNLDLHYGKDFAKFHGKLLERLVKKNKGISLFHGVPGSGKSYYINHLISELKELTKKKIILVPTNMVAYLLEPEFNTFLMDMLNESTYDSEEYGEILEEDDNAIVNGIIFILEDAEPVLMKREDSYSAQSTSNILNLTNGLLNSIFKIQIIATYNTDDSNIDPAILRDKRLIAKREFKELSLEGAKELAKTIEIAESEITEPMTVAQIYALLDKEDDEILIEHKKKDIKEKKRKAGLTLK